jgi:hypothetical protein
MTPPEHAPSAPPAASAQPLAWERVESTSKAMVPLVFRARVPGGYLVATQFASGPFQTVYVPCEGPWDVKLHGAV